jgi:hypothetical protein
MDKFKKYLKRFGTDVAGYGLIVLGIATGWLPGPGGIPLILAGLGLLSIHNEWAQKIVDVLKEQGSKFMGYAFPNNKRAQFAHDVLVILLIGAAAYIYLSFSGIYSIGIPIALTALAIVDFLYNRNRLRYFKRKQK